jgi:predicted dehydrogenase
MRFTRRNFVQQSAAALVGAGLGSLTPAAIAAERHRVSPNDRIGLGLIGVNGMGWANLHAHLDIPGTDAIALCDVDRRVLARRATELQERTGQPPLLFGDYRELLDQPDIDVVIIATPDHWHALQMIAACEAGKDVYVEKPLANSIEEIDRMIAAARRYDRIVQVGQWQRSGPHWDSAMAFVQSGELGNIRLVKSWAYMGWDTIGIQPDQAPPEGVDYDMWLGPAPQRPFNANRFHWNWRWFWDYAGGLMTDWGVHLIDMVLYGMEAAAPKSVMSSGGKYARADSGMETPDTQTAIYEFDDFMMVWESAVGIAQGPYGRDHGVAFIGNNGTLVIDRSKWEIISEVRNNEPLMEPQPVHFAGRNDLGRHTSNFIECVKSRTQPTCNPEVGRVAALNAQLGNIAFKTGRKVYWDRESNRFPGDDEANALMRPQYRAPWVLPEG